MKPATVAAAIFLMVVAMLQLLRAVAGVRVTVGDTVIPIWVSVVAFVVAGGLAIGLWREARRNG
jgi:protein-S-isoprenylcysteine O-methyltransferase Ste14